MTPYADGTGEPARRSDRGLTVVAVVAGCLLAWGAFALLAYIDDDDLGRFWIRLGVGIALAGATVWSATRRKWLLTCFLGLACCITPVAADWTWVQLLYVGLALWALVKFVAEIMTGRVG